MTKKRLVDEKREREKYVFYCFKLCIPKYQLIFHYFGHMGSLRPLFFCKAINVSYPEIQQMYVLKVIAVFQRSNFGCAL